MKGENALQEAVGALLDRSLRAGCFWYHIPNQGVRSPAFMAALIRMGWRPGMPDICIIFEGRSYFVELKTKTGRLLDSQKERFPQLAAAGAIIGVAKSLDEVLSYLNAWGLTKTHQQFRTSA